ncbi:MAG: serine protease [Actinomycetota bacterium]
MPRFDEFDGFRHPGGPVDPEARAAVEAAGLDPSDVPAGVRIIRRTNLPDKFLVLEGVNPDLLPPKQDHIIDLDTGLAFPVMGHAMDLPRWASRHLCISVEPDKNPFGFVVDDTVVILGTYTDWAHHHMLKPAAVRAACRISPLNKALSASGVLVATDLVVTNSHAVTHIVGANHDAIVGTEVWFGLNSTADSTIPPAQTIQTISAVEAIDPLLDIAVLRLDAAPPDYDPAPVDLTNKPQEGDGVAAVGYPRSVNATAEGSFVMEATNGLKSGGLHNVGRKRWSPGNITLVSGDEIHHDCSTAENSSGSPIIHVESGAVVAIHSGVPLNLGERMNRATSLLAVKQTLLDLGVPDASNNA